MQHVLGAFLAPLLVGLVLTNDAHAQALKDNIPEGDPVFEGELRPITEPIRLRYADSLPVETVMESVVSLPPGGATLEILNIRTIHDVTKNATQLNLDIVEATGGLIPRLHPGTKVAELTFSMSADRRGVADLLSSNFPAMTAGEPPPVLPPDTEELLLVLAMFIIGRLPDVIEKAGDPFDPDPAGSAPDSFLAQFSASMTVLGVSSKNGRDVLVVGISFDGPLALPGEPKTDIVSDGFLAIDLVTGATLSGLVRSVSPDGTQFIRIEARVLTEADRLVR